MMKNIFVNLRSFRRRRRNDRGRQAMLPIYSELIGLSVFVSRISEKRRRCAFALSRLFGFSASSDDDDETHIDAEIVPKASSERSRKTKT